MVILTSSILVIAYIVLLPLILNTYSPAWIAWHVCYGHWNLIMIAFHYYKAAKTSPGYPPTVSSQNLLLCRTTGLTVLPFFCSLKIYYTFSFSQEKNDRPFVSVCKKCIMPKPARTHHCGICNRWVNVFTPYLNQVRLSGWCFSVLYKTFICMAKCLKENFVLLFHFVLLSVWCCSSFVRILF